MKLALCVFFNYPYPKNIKIWRELYGDIFEEIVFVQPMEEYIGPESVFTVYRAAFNFGGFFSDIKSALVNLDVDAVVFAGDDCILNPNLFTNDFFENFAFSKGAEIFFPKFLNFCEGEWWNNAHKLNVLARFVGQYGLYDQRIENWLNYLPQKEDVIFGMEQLNIPVTGIKRPDSIERFTPSQREVVNRIFGQGLSALLPYPLVYGVSDFFIVGKGALSDFCHRVGLFATMNIFPEVAVPTALVSTGRKIAQASDVGLSYNWTYGRNKEVEHFWPKSMAELQGFIDDFEEKTLFVHPIKLSKIDI